MTSNQTSISKARGGKPGHGRAFLALALAVLICVVQYGAMIHGLSHALDEAAVSHLAQASSTTAFSETEPADQEATCLTCIALGSIVATAVAVPLMFTATRNGNIFATRHLLLIPRLGVLRARARSPPTQFAISW